MFGSLENFVGWSWKYFSHEADTEPFQLFQIVYIMFKSVMVPYVARVFQVRPPNRSIEIWFGFVWTASRSILTNFTCVGPSKDFVESNSQNSRPTGAYLYDLGTFNDIVIAPLIFHCLGFSDYPKFVCSCVGWSCESVLVLL